jgi:hypothetical protein
MHLIKFVLFSLTCCLFSKQVTAKRPLDIYYISIGSGHYIQDINLYTKEYTGFDNVLPATNSAAIFANLLDSCHLVSGIRLISTDSTLITRQQIVDSTSSLIARALNQTIKRKRDALILFYYCGHGLMADSSNDLFLVPGNFKCDNIREYQELATNALLLNNLFAEALFNVPGKLKFKSLRSFKKAKSRLNFSIVLDCCYNVGKVNNEVIDALISLQESKLLFLPIGALDVTVITDGLAKFLIKRTKQEFLTAGIYQSFASTPDSGLIRIRDLSEHPLLIHYAAAPGNYAQIITSAPNDIDEREAGPLCSRFIQSFTTKKKFTYADFTFSLTPERSLKMEKDKYMTRLLGKQMR